MNQVVFRVNASQNDGIGHLVRCANLADELTKLGLKCHFILSILTQRLTPFIRDFSYECLYDTQPIYLDSKIDAELTKTALAGRNVSCLVVDDYHLGKDWEKYFYGKGIQLAVIDDILREHLCDILIDYRWRGENTHSAYNDKVPKHTNTLLGSNFVILDDKYQHSIDIALPQNDSFNILVGIGGGGELAFIQNIIDSLLRLIPDFNLLIMPIVGPMVENRDVFITQYEDEDRVEIIQNCPDLFPYIRKCDLYIGAAGGILYQLLALNKPALTFAIADNQQNPISFLEDIGHYFHCNEIFDANEILNFVKVVMLQYQRILALPSKVSIVDGLGAKRVAYALTGKPWLDAPSTKSSHISVDAYTILSDHYRIRDIIDTDVNHYLDSRNLPANAQNMIESKPITRLSHYSWWLNNRRSSYLLEKDEQAALYIWHQLQVFQQHQFLIGGWFVCTEHTSFQDSLLALNWQLAYCDEHFPHIPWIAVIHRKNRYVKLMNDYLGFKEVPPKHPYYEAIGTIFAKAHIDDFFFVMREAQEDANAVY